MFYKPKGGRNIDYKEFVNQIAEQLMDILPDTLHGAKVTAEWVNKPQCKYYGIVITPANSKLGACYNLENEYRQFSAGEDHRLILHQVLDILENALENVPFHNEDVLSDYDSVRKRLMLQAIPIVGNETMLGSVPHVTKEDIALIYRIVIRDTKDTLASSIITNRLLESYQITPEQLHQDAMEYAPKNYPVSIRSMREILAEEFGEDIPLREGDMFVAAYSGVETEAHNGAGCLFYPDFFRQAAEKIGGDYFILPSSTHEIILIPDNSVFSAQYLDSLVRTVNYTEVKPEDRLTNTAYHYDVHAKLFETAAAYEQRRESAFPRPAHQKPKKNRNAER